MQIYYTGLKCSTLWRSALYLKSPDFSSSSFFLQFYLSRLSSLSLSSGGDDGGPAGVWKDNMGLETRQRVPPETIHNPRNQPNHGQDEGKFGTPHDQNTMYVPVWYL